ncbi:MAG: response regulator, partial [Bacteroidota bacterium]
ARWPCSPWRVILGFGDLLIQPGITPEEQLLYLSLLEVSSNRLMNTVTNYMDIALIASGNMKINLTLCNLADVLNQLKARFLPVCSEKNLGLVLDIPTNSAKITLHSDTEVFLKIMTHLLDNAVKFSDKGTITFGFTVTPAGAPDIPDGIPPEPEFFVRDAGIGIDSESLSRIFESFAQEQQSSTRDHEGSGLGLSIAHGLVKLLGGSLCVESEKGSGSLFSFTLPCSVLGLGIIYKKEEEKPSIGNLKNHVILVAEDDESNSLFIETILRKTGIPVLVANNGKTAVDLCRQHPEISIVLMDIKMPVMDGLQATREIKSFRKELPVIALTAYAMSSDEDRVYEAGCDDYLTKPLNREGLMKKLRFFRIIP